MFSIRITKKALEGCCVSFLDHGLKCEAWPAIIQYDFMCYFFDALDAEKSDTALDLMSVALADIGEMNILRPNIMKKFLAQLFKSISEQVNEHIAAITNIDSDGARIDDEVKELKF